MRMKIEGRRGRGQEVSESHTHHQLSLHSLVFICGHPALLLGFCNLCSGPRLLDASRTVRVGPHLRFQDSRLVVGT